MQGMMKSIVVLLATVAIATCLDYNNNMLDELDAVVAKRGAAMPVGDIRVIALHAHNKVRANHKATPPLTWDNGLAQGALVYALELANTGKFEHSTAAQSLGENLFKGQQNIVKGFEVAAFFWYNEIQDYDFKQAFIYDAYGITGLGHFTQMVWATTTKVGCAGASIINGRTVTTVYVCRYSPPGNVPGRFHKHVHELINLSAVPKSPLDYQKKCEDKIPGYCANVPQANCVSSTFGKWNQEQCPKRCGIC